MTDWKARFDDKMQTEHYFSHTFLNGTLGIELMQHICKYMGQMYAWQSQYCWIVTSGDFQSLSDHELLLQDI